MQKNLEVRKKWSFELTITDSPFNCVEIKDYVTNWNKPGQNYELEFRQFDLQTIDAKPNLNYFVVNACLLDCILRRLPPAH